MYCNFYNLSEKPFDVTPDPKFLYLSQAHRETFASLVYGIRERRGFISVVGEVGTGKTTLLNAVLDRVKDDTKVAYIFNTDVTFKQLLITILEELGVARSDEGISKIEAISRLNDFAIQELTKGRNVAIIVDEAQNLDSRTMESLRLLSNLETRKYKLLQIILSGQPELDIKLNQPELRQLTQRISLKRYVTPLSEQETSEYIQHRLTVAGHNGSSIFSQGAQQLIWDFSGGVPRKINILCDNAFLIGFGLGKNRIKSPIVKEAIKDLSWSPFLGTISTGPSFPEAERMPKVGSIGKYFPRLAVIASLMLVTFLIFTGMSNQNKTAFDSLNLKKAFYEIQGHFARALSFIKIREEKDKSHNSRKSVELSAVTARKNTKTSTERTLPDMDATLSVLDSNIVSGNKETNGPAKSIAAEEKDPTELENGQSHNPNKQVELSAEKKKPTPTPSTQATVTNVDETLSAREKNIVSGNEEIDLPVKSKFKKTEDQAEQVKYIAVNKADHLSLIIKQTYGTYSNKILWAVLRLNPQIHNADIIHVGQIIKLPLFEDKL